MYEESAISLFRKLPETKSQVSHYSKLIRESVLGGEVNPLLFYQQLAALEQVVKSLKEDKLISDCILEEAEKYHAKTFKFNTSTFCVKEVGVTYDFTMCQDADYEEIEAESFNIGQRKKIRETFLKSIKPGMEVYGKDGRQIEPPVKKSTTKVTITLE